MRKISCVFCFVNVLSVPVIAQASLQQPGCAAELDQAVAQYNSGKVDESKQSLEQMLEACAHLPQVHHNLGVISGADYNWVEAEAHFQRAIEHDARTSMTVAHLSEMHQYRAAQAYQNVLKVKQTIQDPDFQMQDSSLVNIGEAGINLAVLNKSELEEEQSPKLQQTNSDALSDIELTTIPTIEYELYSWWSAAAHNDTSAWLEHYSAGYPPQENNDAQMVGWSEIKTDISLVAEDAVVVLSYRTNNVDKHTLLQLRLQNRRWKIYREANL